MNPNPDYSAAYVILQTDSPEGLAGHGFSFTIGRGNEICVGAINALKPLVVGKTLESFTTNMSGFWRRITGDSQLRWIGLCEYVQHLSIFDYICVSASLEDRILEYVDHLYEHFMNPVVIKKGRYMPPSAPGYSATMYADSLDAFEFPHGKMWIPERS